MKKQTKDSLLVVCLHENTKPVAVYDLTYCNITYVRVACLDCKSDLLIKGHVLSVSERWKEERK